MSGIRLWHAAREVMQVVNLQGGGLCLFLITLLQLNISIDGDLTGKRTQPIQ